MRSMFLRSVGACSAGLRRAKVTDLGGDYVRIDVMGVRWGFDPGKHVYAFFPMLNPLRSWENHPFSVLPTALLQPSPHDSDSDYGNQTAGSNRVDAEKQAGVINQVIAPPDSPYIVGVTFFIR